MRFLILFSFFFFSLNSLFSQEEYKSITAIYKISESEAKELYQSSHSMVQDRFFHTYVDTFTTQYYKRKELKGHYLFAKAQGESIGVSIESYVSISAVVLNNDRDFSIQVVDSLGNIIENAKVLLERKKKSKEVFFNKKTKTYQLKKRNRDGFLSVTANGETIFYDVDDKDGKSLIKKKWRRFSSGKFGRFVTTPYRWGRRTYYFFKTRIRGNYWDWNAINPFPKKHKPYKGYIALNKPKYQPSDTVKVSSYLTNHKGKPLTRELLMEVYKRYNRHSKPVIKATLQPTSKGVYNHKFVLQDPLKLDINYQIQFSFVKKSGKKVYVMNHAFKYEDYQLDEADYTFEPTKETYYQGEKIILLAEGKDKNGWTIPDGTIKLVATHKPVSNFYKKEVIVPDTLWVHEQQLDVRGETQIVFPKEKLPAVKMKVNIQAQFSNSNGELQTESLSFLYDDKTENIDFKLEDGYVVINGLKNGKPMDENVELSGDGFANTWVDIKKTIQLPHKERINPFIEKHKIKTTENTYNFYIENQPNEINAYGFRTKDSVSVKINNPHRVPITFQLRTKNKLLFEGQTDSSFYELDLKNGYGKTCFLYYQYVWGGRNISKDQKIIFYNNLLTLETDEPQQVEPGERVQIKVKVKNSKNRPAKNVQLTAGAINSQFDKLSNLKGPQITYKQSKAPFSYDNFTLKEKNQVKKWQIINEEWYKKLELDKSLFYRLRYPNDGVYMQYDTITRDTFYKDVAQFSPYLIKGGKSLPIHLIYVNKELVYYYDVDDNPPYSFVGRPGYNEITLRTSAAVYTIDSVFLKAGHKLEFSVDINNYLKSSFGKNIKRKSTTPYLTPAEKALLRKRIFFIRNYKIRTNNYVWQDGATIHKLPIHKFNSRRTYKIGPFFPNKNLKTLETDGWNNTFLFEPGFIYEVKKNRERLFAHEPFPNKTKKYLGSISPKHPSQLIYTPSDVIINTGSTAPDISTYFITRLRRIPNGGTYQFNFTKDKKNSPDSVIYAIVLLENDTTFTFFSPGTNNIKNLKPNNYQFFAFTHSGNFIKKEISISANTLLYHDLSNETVTIDTSRQYLDTLINRFREQLVKNKKITKQQSLSFQKNNQSSNSKYPYRNTAIAGKVYTKDGKEELIGANVSVFRDNVFVTGASTDFDGNFKVKVENGIYDIEFSYTGLQTQRIEGVVVQVGQTKILDVEMEEGILLLENVVVQAYKVPLGMKSTTTSASVVTSDQIRNLPRKNINAIAGKAAGVSSSSDVSLIGSRSNATDYYIDGIRVRGSLIPESEIEQLELRSKFSDYAYFNPNLITDRNGEAYFTATFPDNITSWKTFVVGMNKKLQGGTHIGQVKSFNKLAAQLSLPRFMVEGDETNVIGKSINYTVDSFNIQTTFKLEDEIIKSNTALVKEALIESAKISAEENIDSLTMSYQLNMENYGDGEKRSIPIFQQGVKETQGLFHVLEKDTSFQLDFNNQLGEVTIRIEDNVVNVLLEDLEYLRTYPYDCNEQTASRLIALLLKKRVLNGLGKSFSNEDVQMIYKMIKRLKKNQNPDGSWGWWANNKRNYWMTTYVLNALHEADKLKYQTEAYDKGLIFLTNELPQLKGKQLLNTLMLFSDIGQNLDYKKYTTQLDTTQHSLHDKIALIKINQANGLEYSLDTLSKYKKETLFGGWHWGEENYHWYNNSYQISLLAYQIYKKANREGDVKKVRQYFLEKRKRKGWRNTIETARILATILPDLINNSREVSNTVTFGKPNTPVNLNSQITLSGDVNNTITEFPFYGKFSAGQKINIQKQGGSTVFFTAYQEFWNKKPKKKDDLFEVKTELIQKNKATQNLKAAEPVDLFVTIDVKKSGEYIMIEIPIPAGCSYRSKPRVYNGIESHREYFKEKVAIFCREIPVGKHKFKIELEPRFEGKYTLNPTKIEQMYFPVFYGRNGKGELKIEN